jgi:hypothetical protein
MQAGEDPAGRGQVLLWVRAGRIGAGELEADDEAAPRLHRLVLGGLTAADLRPGKADPGTFLDPAVAAEAALDAPARAWVEDQAGLPVADIEAPDETPAREAASVPPGRWSHPAAAMLAKRFGRPPPPGKDEETAVRRIRSAFRGKTPPRNEDKTGEEKTSRGPADPDPTAEKIARRALGALESGSPVVVARESVTDPRGSRERDAALGVLAASVRRRGAVLMVLTVAEGGGDPEPRAVLVISGPLVRSGTVIGRTLPLAAAGATALRIIGVPPPSGREAEAIDAIR